LQTDAQMPIEGAPQDHLKHTSLSGTFGSSAARMEELLPMRDTNIRFAPSKYSTPMTLIQLAAKFLIFAVDSRVGIFDAPLISR
jgi:hypothetical protein